MKEGLSFPTFKRIFLSEKKIFSLTKEALLLFSFAFLTALGAKIKIEIGPVPFTFQTFFVLLSGLLLEAQRASLSQFLYLILGLLGFPYFARGGGLSYLLSPTFGYLLGFILASFLAGFFSQKTKNHFFLLFLLLIANFSIYLFGLPWLAFFLKDLKKAFFLGFFPFWLTDTLKVILLWLFFINKDFFKKVVLKKK
ncbi:MAG: biotin transporter BioY [Minisyncoccales bacterium]